MAHKQFFYRECCKIFYNTPYVSTPLGYTKKTKFLTENSSDIEQKTKLKSNGVPKTILFVRGELCV